MAVATAIITTLVALPAAYAIARYRSAVRNATIGWILISQVFPFILIVIPVFIVLKQIGLINTLPGLVIVYVVWALPFTLWMLQGYVAAIPRDAPPGGGRISAYTLRRTCQGRAEGERARPGPDQGRAEDQASAADRSR